MLKVVSCFTIVEEVKVSASSLISGPAFCEDDAHLPSFSFTSLGLLDPLIERKASAWLVAKCAN